jgi:hypothetical protein
MVRFVPREQTFVRVAFRLIARCGKCHSASPGDELESPKLKMVLSNRNAGGDFTMLPLTRIPSLAAAGALFVLTTANIPARADELAQNLGPVGPHEPILTTVGSKRIIAFYEPDNGRCAVNAVVYDKTDAYTGMTTAARVRVGLNPREMVHIDSIDNETLNLQCGDNAENLAIVDAKFIAAGAAN